ncbi:Glycerate dehydrogenase [Lachnellula hyalina]|uniref:Glycerate dehydrogenase n=1 Tax=Lachnellula hyalina TaxID=1316788 RepID=A0A8H8U3V8_9HELO|nr:Glycerate dehydrogenase [Lachnellula hyalina]TVY30687.1 Glycerate dehydrogenase [Lachnellula hyalina]
MASEEHRIVCLDECHCPSPIFTIAHTYKGYDNTPLELVAERIKDATIVISTRVKIPDAAIAQCPDLQLIAVMAAGFDIVDVKKCRERGIKVSNIPSASAEAVAEHAFTLYLSAKRRVVELHNLTREGIEWPLRKTGTHKYNGVPRTCKSETMGIVGYGNLGELAFQSLRLLALITKGKRIEDMAKAMGMAVIIADRKGTPPNATRPGRTEFTQTLQRSDVLILCCPLDASTRGMIGEAELKLMDSRSLLVNVARGGVVDEDALVKALQNGWISGAAVDVFASEPVTPSTSPLLADGIPNLTLSPHVAWYADSSIKNVQATINSNIESFVAGHPDNLPSSLNMFLYE